MDTNFGESTGIGVSGFPKLFGIKESIRTTR
jgi:hypothetical protein